MKLSKIKIENYRGFYGENEILFDINKKNRDINIVIARNDTGKTTLLNSIYWCLYGKEQFISTKNTGKKIVSNKKVSETSIEGKVKVSVSIILEDEKGPKYKITRERLFKRILDDQDEVKAIQQGEDFFEGMERTPDGKGFIKIKHITSFVNSTIPEGISNFFFLDGEQLKVIFSSDINNKIEESIERVANINVIKNAIKNLKELSRTKYKIKDSEDSNYNQINDEKDKCLKKIEEREGQLTNKRKEMEEITIEKNEIAQFLKENSDSVIKEKQFRKDDLERTNERINNDRKEKESLLDKKIVETYILNATRTYLENTSEKFEKIIKGDNFPPAVDPDHIKQLLRRGICICDRPIKKGSIEENFLKKLIDKDSYKPYVRVISEGAARIPEMINTINNNMNEIKELRIKIKQIESVLEENKREIEEINNLLKESKIGEIRERAEREEVLDREKLRCNSAIDQLERDLLDLESAKKDYERKLSTMDLKEERNKVIKVKQEKAKQLSDYLEKIKNEILKKIKEKIEESTARNFLELHWKAANYEKITILDDFSLSIKDKHGGQIIDELSQGAALCFGLAFMTALRNYSGYDVPIIIDSPVGKIDEGNRENIAKNLPQQLKGKQIIFFVTSSEYTSVFKDILKDQIASKTMLEYNPKTRKVDVTNGCD
jgi:DNA sulfur modification protein DndD